MCSAIFCRMVDIASTRVFAPSTFGKGAGAEGSGGAGGAGGGGGGGAAAATGGGAAGGAEAAGAAPPVSSILPTIVFTPTVVPSVTNISPIVPAAGAGISVSTLSVEISNRGSSRSTLSPGFFSHLVNVPSTILSPIWGITTSIMVSPLSEPAHSFGRFQNQKLSKNFSPAPPPHPGA